MAGQTTITAAVARKLEAKLAAGKGSINAAAVARELDISPHALRRWLKAREKASPEQLLREGLDTIKAGIRQVERALKAKAGD